MSDARSTVITSGSLPSITGIIACRSSLLAANGRVCARSNASRWVWKNLVSSSSSRSFTISSPRELTPADCGSPTSAIIATGALMIMSVVVPGTTSSSAACPATNPPVGITTKLVIPSLRAGASITEFGLSPSQTVNAAAMLSFPLADISRVSPTADTSCTPSCVAALTKPGVTILPVASMRCAPAGIATLRPTAAILPFTITTVPPSIGGPLTGYTLPPVIATVWDPAGAVTATTTTNDMTIRKMSDLIG